MGVFMWAALYVACSGEPATPGTPPEPGSAPAVVAAPAPGATDSTPPVIDPSNCKEMADGGPVAGPGCLTGTLRCGDTVAGHTRGGTSTFDTRFYEAKYCTPATTNHDGGDERVYALTMPEGNHRAIVTLDTPCADLDLAAVRVPGFDACPTVATDVPQCEMWPQASTRRETVELVSPGATTWMIVVEGKDDAEGAFGLTVRCVDGL